MNYRLRPAREVARLANKFVLTVVILFAAVACAGPNPSLYPPRPGAVHRTVYVINHGLLHTGLAIKRADIPRGVWPANRDYTRYKYLEVGWGDDDGYRKPLTTGIAIRALAGSKRTVVLSDGFNRVRTRVDMPKFSVVQVDLSEPGFARLCEHIEQTYALDATGRPIRLGQGWYRGRGTYSAFYTCNTWVASALRKAGCPITPAYCLTSSPLLFQVRRFGKELRRDAFTIRHRRCRGDKPVARATGSRLHVTKPRRGVTHRDGVV